MKTYMCSICRCMATFMNIILLTADEQVLQFRQSPKTGVWMRNARALLILALSISSYIALFLDLRLPEAIFGASPNSSGQFLMVPKPLLTLPQPAAGEQKFNLAPLMHSKCSHAPTNLLYSEQNPKPSFTPPWLHVEHNSTVVF